jgi:hypothetical protein
MRRPLAVLGVALLAASAAWAEPAMPRPLERKVEDADLVVVARLRSRPAHPGDPFDAGVEEVLKGRAPTGPVRVAAAYFFNGCIPPPEGTPPPPSIEGRGDRVLLFLDAERDGVRASRDPIVLGESETASAWFYDHRPAAQAVEAVRALVSLDRELDPARAADLWAKGLAGGNALLVTCLLHRAAFAQRSGDDRWSELGPRLAPRVRQEFAAGRAALLPVVAKLVTSPDEVQRRIALQAAQSLLPRGADAESAAFDEIAAAAIAVPRTDASRGDAVRYLTAARDPALAGRVVAALKRRPVGDDVRDLGDVGRAFFAAFPEREEEVLRELVALLDVNEQFATGTLAAMTGRYVGGAAMWRAWWKEREAAKRK